MPKLTPPLPNPITEEDRWVQTWGEIVNKKTACRMLGLGTTKLYELVNDGTFKTAPDGRILTRCAARYYLQPCEPQKKQMPLRLIK